MISILTIVIASIMSPNCVCLCGCVCHPMCSASHFFVRVQAAQACNTRNWHFPLTDVCVLLPGQNVFSPMTLSAERPGLEALDTPHQPTRLLNHQRSRTKVPPSPVNTPRAFGTALVPTTLPTGGDLPSQAGLDLYSKGPWHSSSEFPTRPTCLLGGSDSSSENFMELSKNRSPTYSVV